MYDKLDLRYYSQNAAIPDPHTTEQSFCEKSIGFLDSPFAACRRAIMEL